MLIQKKYIILPYNNRMTLKHLEFYDGDDLIFDFRIKLDFFTCECLAYINVEPYIGRDISIRFFASEENIIPIDTQEADAVPFALQQTDEIPKCSNMDNRYRPYIHFTTPYGWLNDPNGLVYADGVYHMFYQHNPAGTERENMHWGHAVSSDLFHWEHLGNALCPDNKGTVFSGSAIADRKNLLCLRKKETPLLLFYTAAGGTSRLSEGEPFSICLAYSTDGGRTFERYAGNPLLPNIVKNNRDPKVVWCPPLESYVMALYLEKSQYCLLSSENLLDWRVFQSFTLPGDSECPDIYPLCLNHDPQQTYWVFSGASDHYYVGKFTDGQFVSTQPVKRLHYGTCSYAAQTFSGAPDGRCIRFSWQRIEFLSAPFNGQLSIPGELQLCEIENEIYLCLWPVRELENISGNMQVYRKIVLPGGAGKPFICSVPRGALDIFIQAEYQPDCVLRINVFGAEVVCDMTRNQLHCADSVSPITIKQKQLKLRMILDKNSIELFADQGEFYISSKITCDYHLNWLQLQSDTQAAIQTLRIYKLQLEGI